jgi:hypothetical protein
LMDLPAQAKAKPEQLYFEFAPDVFHKAAVSGGGANGVKFGRLATEAEYTGSKLPFVKYLRTSFRWAGFPGFRHIEGAPLTFLHGLRQGLLPV